MRIDAAGHQGVAQACRVLDDQIIWCGGLGQAVRCAREQHARYARRHLSLDDHPHAVEGQSPRQSIEQRTSGPARGPAGKKRVTELGLAPHAEHRIELAGERRVRAVFANRGAADGHHGLHGQTLCDRVELALNRRGERRRHHERANGLRRAPQPLRLTRIERSRQASEPIGQSIAVDERLKGRAREHHSRWNGRAERDEPRQIACLAADLSLVGGLGERDCERHAARAFPPSSNRTTLNDAWRSGPTMST